MNDLVNLICNEISRCQKVHPNKGVNLANIFKEDVLKQLLLDYSADIMTPVNEIIGEDKYTELFKEERLI